MRDIFKNELDAINESLTEMGALVRTAMRHATTSLLTANNDLAEQTIANDNEIDEMQHDLDSRALMVMARQAPVASDLRILVTALRMSSDFERMGDFAHHIARLARMYAPSKVVPTELEASVREMGEISDRLIEKLIRVIEDRDADLALEIEIDDEDLSEEQIEKLLSVLSWED